MPTQAETSHRNGANSHGPISPEGKARSSQNSLTHGLTSTAVVLPHESEHEFNGLLLSMQQEFRPIGALQHDLVHEMAAARWRLRRVQDLESAVFQKAIRRQQEQLGPKADPAEVQMLAYAAVADSDALRSVTRYASQIRRAYEKAWKELKHLQTRHAAADQVTAQPAEQQNEPNSRPAPRSYLEIYNATLPVERSRATNLLARDTRVRRSEPNATSGRMFCAPEDM